MRLERRLPICLPILTASQFAIPRQMRLYCGQQLSEKLIQKYFVWGVMMTAFGMSWKSRKSSSITTTGRYLHARPKESSSKFLPL